MKHFSIILLFTMSLCSMSCRRGKEMKTESGMKYILYRENAGAKPKTGDWVTLIMVYKDEHDSVLFDSRDAGKPLRFALPKPVFAGSFEDGIAHLAAGDSATFFISADSMYEHVFKKESQEQMLKRPTPGSFLKFDVSLLRIQNYQEAEMEMAMQDSKQEQAEKTTLESYIKEKNISAEQQPEGYYLVIKEQGKGKPVTEHSTISINYTGRFLNGSVFNSNSSTGKPYLFTLGNNEVIKGWELAFLKLHEGDKATMILPSKLAYGSEGLKRPQTLKYVIPPFATLIFDVEVLSVTTSKLPG